MDELVFERDSTNGGVLTFGCLSFQVATEGDEMTEAEEKFLEDLCNLVNNHPGALKAPE